MTPAPAAEATDVEAEPRSRARGSGRWWVGAVVAAAVCALGASWGIERIPLEPYYAAAVRAMAADPHALWFAAFDPQATVTMDKLPGAFWVQAAFVAALGPAPWVMVLSQVIEMVAAVLVLAVAVRRLVGPRAGLTAAFVLAVSPAAVGAARGNVADPAMILLVVAAAWATVRALDSDRAPAWLALAGAFVGLAFQAKMIAAWLVLPALAVTFLVAGRGRLPRRVAAVAVGGVVTAVVSLAWTAVVTLTPASSRPWVDGSAHDSLFEQVFSYNGFGRFGAQNPLQTLSGQGLALTAPGTGAEGPSLVRLFTDDLGRAAGWLLPLALLAAVAGAWATRHRPRTDRYRAAYLLFGTWLLVYGAAFSAGAVINVYYVATLVPAAAGLIGTGAAHLATVWDRRAARVLAAVGVLGTVAYGAVLLASAEHPVLAPVAVAGAAAVVAAVLVVRGRRSGLVVALVAVLLLPLVATAVLAALGGTSFDTPFESPREARAVRVLLVGAPRLALRSLPGIERARAGAPDLLAVQSSAVASVFSGPTGEEVLPIGGFTGTGPTPTLDQVRADVAAGRFHLVLSFPSTDPRLVWIDQHCRRLGASTPPFVAHYCLPADAARP